MKILKVYSTINKKKLQRHLEDIAKRRGIETIISTDMLEHCSYGVWAESNSVHFCLKIY